jgi:hypothetical protein
MRKMQFFQMMSSEHAMNFRTFQKPVTKEDGESHAHNYPFRDQNCVLKGTENL